MFRFLLISLFTLGCGSAWASGKANGFAGTECARALSGTPVRARGVRSVDAMDFARGAGYRITRLDPVWSPAGVKSIRQRHIESMGTRKFFSSTISVRNLVHPSDPRWFPSLRQPESFSILWQPAELEELALHVRNATQVVNADVEPERQWFPYRVIVRYEVKPTISEYHDHIPPSGVMPFEEITSITALIGPGPWLKDLGRFAAPRTTTFFGMRDLHKSSTAPERLIVSIDWKREWGF